ncbi:TPA: SOS response-associated peptidase, partial [Citrobacter freundii]
MCGRFLQSMTREDYLALLADESERDISLNLEPTSQLYSARDIKVQL